MIQVIHRAIDILEYIAVDPQQPKLMGNIAKDLNLNGATCANIIKNLVGRGYLTKANKEEGYLLGQTLLDLSSGAFGYKQLIEIAEKELDEVVGLLQENCMICILKGNNRIILMKKTSGQVVQAVTPHEKDAYDSSTGRLLLALLSDKDLNLFVKQYGLPSKKIWPQADTTARFMEQIEVIRAQGFALIEDMYQITGIATPIYKNGKAIAGFSIYMPSFRFNEEIKKKIIEAAISTAKKLSI